MTLARHPAPLSGAGLRGNNAPSDWPPVAIVPRRGRDPVKLTHPLIGRMRGEPGPVRYACSEVWSRCRRGKQGGDCQPGGCRWVRAGGGGPAWREGSPTFRPHALWAPVPECALMPRCPPARRVCGARSSVGSTGASGGYVPARSGRTHGGPGRDGAAISAIRAPPGLSAQREAGRDAPPSLGGSRSAPFSPAGAQDSPRPAAGEARGRPLVPTAVTVAAACWRSAAPPSRQVLQTFGIHSCFTSPAPGALFPLCLNTEPLVGVVIKAPGLHKQDI